MLQYILRLILAPGIILHELAHKEVAEDLGLRIQEVCYFQLKDDPPGYVTHETPRTYGKMLAVSGAPFLFNTLASFALFTGFSYYLLKNGQPESSEAVAKLGAVVWMGITTGSQAFPSATDINNIWQASKDSMFSIGALLGVPIITVMYVLDRTRKFRSNYLYTGGLGFIGYQFAVFILSA